MNAKGHVAGDILLRPAPVAALGVVVLNDLWLKPHHPSLLSGILSDLALCFLVPLLCMAAWEWVRWLVRRPAEAGLWVRGLGCGVTALYFAGLQLLPSVASLHVTALETAFPSRNFGVTPDPWDLAALIMVPVAWRYGRGEPGPRHGEGHRPPNPARLAYHLVSSLVALVAVETLIPPPLFPWVAVPAALVFWTGELLRREWSGLNDLVTARLGWVLHPREAGSVSSGTWYLTALALLSLTRDPLLGGVAIVVVGLGDPAASFVGRRFGRIRLATGRTLTGSLAFFAAAALGSAGVLWLWHGSLTVETRITIAIAAALAGALAEAFSQRVDDNLTVPLAAAAAALWVG